MAVSEGQWVHMVGIGGAGMSGIARVLSEQGVRVSGSDLQISDATKKLQNMGIEIYEGHASFNVKEGVDLLVVSSAIPRHNVEVEAAKAQNIPVLKRGQMLAMMANDCKGIAVAGAHGKTTTTSMIYAALTAGGIDPTLIVGGEIQGSEINARLGRDEYFVLEADESDASFLELQPYVGIVTNIENDHLDYYKSFDLIKKAFQQFINQVNPSGFSLLYGGDECVRELCKQAEGKIILYGEDLSYDYCLQNWKSDGIGSIFDVYKQEKLLGKIQLTIPGKHNALNALAAVAVAVETGCGFDALSEALRNFKGAHRRFELLGKTNNITVVDDYAHHPTEIKATVHAAREVHQGRLVVIFQPHRYSRTALLAEQFGEAFVNTDLLIVTGIYSAGEKAIQGVSGELVYQSALKAGCKAVYIPTLDQVEDYLSKELKENDLLITMGAGDVWKLGAAIIERHS